MSAGRVLIGRILKAHGVRGEVTFAPAGDDPGCLRPGLPVFLGPVGDVALTIRVVHPGDRFWLLGFVEVANRDDAGALAGRSLFVDEEALPPLPEGEFYQFQLVGLAVTRSEGTELGRVARVVDMPGQDLLEVQGAGGDFLVPIRREFVEWIDLERGEIRLADRADLLEAQRRNSTPGEERAESGRRIPARGGPGRRRPLRKGPDRNSG